MEVRYKPCPIIGFNIIVVIMTWPREKPSEKNNFDITVIWFSNWFKWANLLKISSLKSQFSTNKRTLSAFCCLLFAVFIKCLYTASSFSFNYYTKLTTYTANNHLNPKLIPELLNNLYVNASDVMLEQ